MSTILGVLATGLDTPEGTEWLRILTALRAVGRAVEVAETGAGVGAFDGALEDEAERCRDALVEDGVQAVAVEDEAAFVRRVDAAASVVVLAPRDRTGAPPFLRRPDGATVGSPAATVLAAGVVVRR